jgi:hypothetical protein
VRVEAAPSEAEPDSDTEADDEGEEIESAQASRAETPVDDASAAPAAKQVLYTLLRLVFASLAPLPSRHSTITLVCGGDWMSPSQSNGMAYFSVLMACRCTAPDRGAG